MRYGAKTAVDGLSLDGRDRVGHRDPRARTAPARPPPSRPARATAVRTAGQVRVLGLDPVDAARRARPAARGDAAVRRCLDRRPGRRDARVCRRRCTATRCRSTPSSSGSGLASCGSTPLPAAQRRAAAAARRWRWPWSAGRSWSSSTSRPPASTRRPAGPRGSWSRSCATTGVTVVLTTHYMDEAERLASYVYVVDRGRVITSGTPARADVAAGAEHDPLPRAAGTRHSRRSCSTLPAGLHGHRGARRALPGRRPGQPARAGRRDGLVREARRDARGPRRRHGARSRTCSSSSPGGSCGHEHAELVLSRPRPAPRRLTDAWCATHAADGDPAAAPQRRAGGARAGHPAAAADRRCRVGRRARPRQRSPDRRPHARRAWRWP